MSSTAFDITACRDESLVGRADVQNDQIIVDCHAILDGCTFVIRYTSTNLFCFKRYQEGAMLYKIVMP